MLPPDFLALLFKKITCEEFSNTTLDQLLTRLAALSVDVVPYQAGSDLAKGFLISFLSFEVHSRTKHNIISNR